MESQYTEQTDPLSIPPPLPPISESSEHFKKLRDIHSTMDNLNISHTEDEASSTDSGCDEEEEAALQEFRTWVKAQPHFVNCRTGKKLYHTRNANMTSTISYFLRRQQLFVTFLANEEAKPSAIPAGSGQVLNSSHAFPVLLSRNGRRGTGH